MLFEFARANSYKSAYTDEISQVKFANLISVSIKLQFSLLVKLPLKYYVQSTVGATIL